jgi:hypothetical protein
VPPLFLGSTCGGGTFSLPYSLGTKLKVHKIVNAEVQRARSTRFDVRNTVKSKSYVTPRYFRIIPRTMVGSRVVLSLFGVDVQKFCLVGRTRSELGIHLMLLPLCCVCLLCILLTCHIYCTCSPAFAPRSLILDEN